MSAAVPGRIVAAGVATLASASVLMRQTPISERSSPHTSRNCQPQMMTLPERMVLAKVPCVACEPWKLLCGNKIGRREVG
jgi:hypothetical protein